MSLPTLSDITAVDPVLTNMLVGYKQDASRFIADQIFPPLTVVEKSGTYYIFDKKYWFTNQMRVRVPGQDFFRVDFGVSTTTYDTVQQALAVPLADEIRNANQAAMSLEEAAVELLYQKDLISREVAFAAAFGVTSIWANEDNDSATDWDDFVSGDPVAGVLLAARTISDSTGVSPNTMAVGSIVNDAIVNHPDILDRIKYVQMPTVMATSNALASLFGIERYLVSKASYSDTNEAASFSASAIWDDDALICFVNGSPAPLKPSAGYTFVWPGGGGDGVITNTRDGLTHSDLIQFKAQWDQKVVANDLGYLFIGIV